MDIEIMARIGVFGTLPLIVLLALLLVAAKEVGFRLGTIWRRRSGNVEGAGVIVGSILALTAFVLALTLSAATARMAERRAATLAEANAISSLLQLTDLLGDEGAAMRPLIHDYVDQRMIFMTAGRGSDSIAAASDATADLQTAIWEQVSAAAMRQRDAVTASAVNTAIAMFDSTAATRFAMENGLPVPMVRLLMVMAIGAMVSLGLQLGLLARPNYLLALVLGLFWAAVIVLILDMGTARVGRFEIETAPYAWVIGPETPGG